MRQFMGPKRPLMHMRGTNHFYFQLQVRGNTSLKWRNARIKKHNSWNLPPLSATLIQGFFWAAWTWAAHTRSNNQPTNPKSIPFMSGFPQTEHAQCSTLLNAIYPWRTGGRLQLFPIFLSHRKLSPVDCDPCFNPKPEHEMLISIWLVVQ